MDNVELAPLRSLEDFLLGSARFQAPSFNDPVRWNNRIVNNLLYYQSNYFLTALIIFLLIGVMHPAQMVLGMICIGSVFAVFVYASNSQAQLRKFKRHHPAISMIVVFILGYVLVYFLGSVLVFVFGIACPMLACLVHASLRLRNIRNKISNRIDYVGLKRTPMGLILEALGQESEAGS